MVPVIWLNHHKAEDCIERGYWDQGMLELLFDGKIWDVPGGFEFTHMGSESWTGSEGAVVVLPARFHVEDIDRLNQELIQHDWVLLILSSDEESLFPWDQLVDHPHMNVWISTPRPDLHSSVKNRFPDVQFIGVYFKEDTLDILSDFRDLPKTEDFFFSGQGGHQRRDEAIAAFEAVSLDSTNRTGGFTQGLDRVDYLKSLSTAKVAPCPSGPVTPDNFRLYEALEAGCYPLADRFASIQGYPDGYWQMIFGSQLPFTLIDKWEDFPKELEHALSEWPANATRASSLWQLYKRSLAWKLHSDIQKLSRVNMNDSDGVTVIVLTSPIPSHPSTDMIAETIESVRRQLPRCEILIMADGVREEQEDRRADYEEYLNRLTRLCNSKWTNVVPIIFGHHAHQANLTRRALEEVKTPLILFMEHDAPLTDDYFDWGSLQAAVRSGSANIIRFHHEASVLEPHKHLMLDSDPVNVQGASLLRTVQWSQRPHLASTGFYRTMIGSYFGVESRTMIEDVMHGVLENAWVLHGEAGWEQFRVWLYSPDTKSIKRSYHLDGREDDEKFGMVVKYDGEVPEGAPQPGILR